jgi:hypothetical protein
MKRLFRAPASCIFAGFAVILCFALLFLFPSRSIDPVWKGYRVLVVPLSEEETSIVDRLAKNGITAFATESNSMIPNTNEMAPAVSFLPAKNRDIAPWFRNDDQKIRYIYLEEKPFLESRIDRAFADASFDWTLERADGIHAIPVILAALFLAVLLVLCRDRLFMAASGLPLLAYALVCNQYPAFLASIIAIYGSFLLERFLEPARAALSAKQRLVRMRNNSFILIPWLAVIPVLPFGGILSGLLFFAALGASAALVYLALSFRNFCFSRKELQRLHPAFRPNLMHPGSIGKKKPAKIDVFPVLPIPALALGALFLFGSGSLPNQNQAGDGGRELYIPSPSEYTARTGFDASGYESLVSMQKKQAYPDLAWFLSVRWNLETAAWRRASEAFADPVPGATIDCMEYAADDNGKISGKKDTIMTFDSNFIRKTLSGPLTPLEHLLVSQGRFASVNLLRHSK